MCTFLLMSPPPSVPAASTAITAIFDRMIAAQAIAEDIPVISKDPKLDGFGIRRFW